MHVPNAWFKSNLAHYISLLPLLSLSLCCCAGGHGPKGRPIIPQMKAVTVAQQSVSHTKFARDAKIVMKETLRHTLGRYWYAAMSRSGDTTAGREGHLGAREECYERNANDANSLFAMMAVEELP